MRHQSPVVRRLALAIPACVLMSCASSPPVATPSSTTPPASLAPSRSPSAAPSIDVAAVFASRMTGAKSARLRVSGTVDTPTLHGTITGHREFEGASLSVASETVYPTSKITTAQVEIGQEAWRKQGSAPWFKHPPGTISVGGGVGKSTGPAADVIRSVQVQGTVDFNGEQLVRLVPSAAAKLTPKDVGLLTTPGAEAHFVEFLAKPDGTPRVIRLEATFTQSDTGRPIPPVKNVIELAVESLDEPVVITKPGDVWVVFHSKRYGYSLAHPEEWEYVRDKDGEAFESATGPSVFVSSDGRGGLSLNGWTSDAIGFWLKQWKKRPEKNEAIRVAGQRARLLTYHVVNGNRPTFFMDATVIKGSRGYDFQWYDDPAREAADRQMFLRIVATVTFP